MFFELMNLLLPRSMGLRGCSLGDAVCSTPGSRQLDAFQQPFLSLSAPSAARHSNFGKLTLSSHAPTGVSAYCIGLIALGGGFHPRYNMTVGVTPSDEPQLLAVNLICSSAPPTPTGHYLVDMLPRPDQFSVKNHLVASGRQTRPLTRVVDLEPGVPRRSRPRPAPAHERSARYLDTRQSSHWPFPWPTDGTPGLRRFGLFPRSCSSHSLAFACTARAIEPGPPFFDPARLGLPTATSASSYVRPA